MKHINSTIHWWYDINVVMYPFAKIQIIPSFDPWKREASDAFEKISSSILKHLQSSLPQRGKGLRLENAIFELQPSYSSKTKEYRKGAESMGNSHKLDNFFRSAMTSEPRLVVNESRIHLWAVCWQSSLANASVARVLLLAVTIDTN